MTNDSVLSSRKMFGSRYGLKTPDFAETMKLKLAVKVADEYAFAFEK